jgi:hypothetical protein
MGLTKKTRIDLSRSRSLFARRRYLQFKREEIGGVWDFAHFMGTGIGSCAAVAANRAGTARFL